MNSYNHLIQCKNVALSLNNYVGGGRQLLHSPLANGFSGMCDCSATRLERTYLTTHVISSINTFFEA